MPKAYYRLALAEFHLGHLDSSEKVLDDLDAEFDDNVWAEVRVLRGDIHMERGNPTSALIAWEEAWQVASEDRIGRVRAHVADEIRSARRDSLAAALDLVENEDLLMLIQAEIKRPRRQRRPMRRYESAGSSSNGIPPARGNPSFDFHRRRTGVNPGTRGRRPRIAAILPMSGNHAIYGERVLSALRLALGDADDEALEVIDTRGSAETAMEAFDRVAEDPEIGVIFGPMRSDAAEALTQKAEDAMVPMLLLSQRDGLENYWSLQIGMTPRQQADALADYAVLEQGLEHFAILRPDDRYGRALSRAFRSAIVERGGSIVGTFDFEPGTRDLEVVAEALDRWHRTQDEIEAVFIPDTPRTGGRLATLVRERLPDALMLGANAWNHPSLERASGATSGLIFTDGFFLHSKRDETRDFLDLFESATVDSLTYSKLRPTTQER